MELKYFLIALRELPEFNTSSHGSGYEELCLLGYNSV
jgi:hypothetical protein